MKTTALRSSQNGPQLVLRLSLYLSYRISSALRLFFNRSLSEGQVRELSVSCRRLSVNRLRERYFDAAVGCRSEVLRTPVRDEAHDNISSHKHRQRQGFQKQ